jgi:hypothetical protein
MRDAFSSVPDGDGGFLHNPTPQTRGVIETAQTYVWNLIAMCGEAF